VNYSRLVGIKHKYDVDNFFRRNSNIAPGIFATRPAGA